jgi:hypothetical protein
VHRQLGLILICVSSLLALEQTPSSSYQPGTITAVTTHQNAPGDSGDDVVRYDVSVKIGNVLYVVLYTPLHGAHSVEYSAGIEMLFSVGTDTITFNSKLSGTTELPILRREVLPAEKALDWSKAPGEYLSMKQHHLSEALGLSEEQQAKIKPILDQEAGEAGMILWTPVVPPKDRFKQYQKIVRASDAKIKPFLTSTQVDKLQQLRKQQVPELKRLIAQQTADGQNLRSN